MNAGMMYIANSFKTVGSTESARARWPVDNGPHFWSSPPSWGICRPDLRRKAAVGQTIFFVLSKHAQHPQMIFGYMKIKEIVSHLAAHRKLPQKRRLWMASQGGRIGSDPHRRPMPPRPQGVPRYHANAALLPSSWFGTHGIIASSPLGGDYVQ